jgi:hypothetical protein
VKIWRGAGGKFHRPVLPFAAKDFHVVLLPRVGFLVAVDDDQRADVDRFDSGISLISMGGSVFIWTSATRDWGFSGARQKPSTSSTSSTSSRASEAFSQSFTTATDAALNVQTGLELL